MYIRGWGGGGVIGYKNRIKENGGGREKGPQTDK